MSTRDRRTPNGTRAGRQRDFNQNDGAVGYVYILQNEAFQEDWLKIGQSRRSGHARAKDLNVEAGTGTPKHFRCVLEVQTLDCGRAERAVFERLREYRTGRQEFFRVSLSEAERVIREECSRINREVDAISVKRAQQLQHVHEQAVEAERRSNADRRRQKALQQTKIEAAQRQVSVPPLRAAEVDRIEQERLARATAAKQSKRPPPSSSMAKDGRLLTPQQVEIAWLARDRSAMRVPDPPAHSSLYAANAHERQGPAPIDRTMAAVRWLVALTAITGALAYWL